jgi:hypothetical protein
MIETMKNRWQCRQKTPKVHVDGYRWMKTKKCCTGELITNKFRRDSKEPVLILLIWMAVKSVLELQINHSFKLHPVLHNLHFQASFNNRMNCKDEIVTIIFKFKMIKEEKIQSFKTQEHSIKFISNIDLKKSMKTDKMTTFII